MSVLRGKSALVTGASSGFGRAIALTFAAAGAQVAIVGRDEARLQATADEIESQGSRALVCVADIADEAQIQAVFDKTNAEFGQIDILVNNAGMNVTARTIADTTADEWRQLLDVNLSAAFLFTKLVLPEMVSRTAGTIINVASRAALFPHLAGGVGYSASKIGMDALTQVTNEEANPHNVRACLLCPGVGNTPLLDRRPKPPPEEQRVRMLQPDDVAAVALLVASMPAHVNVDLISMRPTNV